MLTDLSRIGNTGKTPLMNQESLFKQMEPHLIKQLPPERYCGRLQRA